MIEFWDTYVEEWKGDGLPGDEWGNPPAWSSFYQRFFAGARDRPRLRQIHRQGPGKPRRPGARVRREREVLGGLPPPPAVRPAGPAPARHFHAGLPARRPG